MTTNEAVAAERARIIKFLEGLVIEERGKAEIAARNGDLGSVSPHFYRSLGLKIAADMLLREEAYRLGLLR